MNITKQIEGKHYVATERDVELLAHEHLTSTQSARRSDGAYLRILIVGLQAQFNGTANKRRALKPTELKAHSDFLAEQHGRLYVYVLKGVTTPEVMDDETLDVAVRRARAAELKKQRARRVVLEKERRARKALRHHELRRAACDDRAAGVVEIVGNLLPAGAYKLHAMCLRISRKATGKTAQKQ